MTEHPVVRAVTAHARPVIVGVSPATGSASALRWAADEAQMRGVPLLAILAWRPPRPPGSPGTRPPTGLPAAAEDHGAAAERMLWEYVQAALGDDVQVGCAAVRGKATQVLLSVAENAQLLVLGEPRPSKLNAVKGAVKGVVAPTLVLRAPCPVVVMPASSRAH